MSNLQPLLGLHLLAVQQAFSICFDPVLMLSLKNNLHGPRVSVIAKVDSLFSVVSEAAAAAWPETPPPSCEPCGGFSERDWGGRYSERRHLPVSGLPTATLSLEPVIKYAEYTS